MAGRLAGKVALVTGAASGLGAATARAFAAAGASVVVADIQAGPGDALARELGNAAFIRTDVTVEDEVAAAVDVAVARFGRLDCCVNNAGVVGAIGSIRDTSQADWDRTIAVLLRSVFFGMKHAARVMVPQGSGCILAMSSVAGVAGGLGPHVYTAAKHGVVGLVHSVASELAPLGIRVNAVAPGSVVTPLVAEVSGGMDAAIARSVARSPMRAPLMPQDIAAGLLYLASDDGARITGQTLVIDGGLTGCGFGADYHSRPASFMGGAAVGQTTMRGSTSA